jgi:hypothetical protein
MLDMIRLFALTAEQADELFYEQVLPIRIYRVVLHNSTIRLGRGSGPWNLADCARPPSENRQVPPERCANGRRRRHLSRQRPWPRVESRYVI